MNERINRFEHIWNATRLVKPRLTRSFNLSQDEFPRTRLTRQTNEHEILPRDLWIRWWDASEEEKKNIFMEYESTLW
jgi:hypothetical protein